MPGPPRWPPCVNPAALPAVALALLLTPTIMLSESMMVSAQTLSQRLEAGDFEVPPPRESVKDWPLIGDRVYDGWLLASDNLEEALSRIEPQLRKFSAWLLSTAVGTGLGVLAFQERAGVGGESPADPVGDHRHDLVVCEHLLGAADPLGDRFPDEDQAGGLAAEAAVAAVGRQDVVEDLAEVEHHGLGVELAFQLQVHDPAFAHEPSLAVEARDGHAAHHDLGHRIQGLKNMKEAYRPEIFEKKLLDEIVNIDDEDAFEMTRRLAKEEGIFVGMSSGAAMVIAQKKAEELTDGTIVVILPDGGERYLSTTLFAVQEKVNLNLFNTMSRSKEPFEPILPGKVSMYSCGPTANARLHLGQCRRFIFSDLLCRYLEYRGYDVTLIMNITDLDDKTIDGSEDAGLDLTEFTAQPIKSFKEDLKILNIKPASNYPKASEHVDDMVSLSEKLVKKGFAYEKLRSLYFDISRFSDYGRLSGVDLDKIKLGATVDLDEYEKDNPRDFTLLKRSKLSELKRGIFTKTDWGNIRPSWHIQCTAMAMKYLGETYDIHTSSRELVFPHHENEIAIAGAVTGKPLARFWVHCDRVLVHGKIVNEQGAGETLSDLTVMGYTGREIRYWLISGHYRKPITFSKEHLENAKSSLKRIDSCTNSLVHMKPGGSPYPELDQLLYDIKQGFVSAMDDDLNI